MRFDKIRYPNLSLFGNFLDYAKASLRDGSAFATPGGRGDSAAINPDANGPVWFVRGIRTANRQSKEILST